MMIIIWLSTDIRIFWYFMIFWCSLILQLALRFQVWIFAKPSWKAPIWINSSWSDNDITNPHPLRRQRQRLHLALSCGKNANHRVEAAMTTVISELDYTVLFKGKEKNSIKGFSLLSTGLTKSLVKHNIAVLSGHPQVRHTSSVTLLPTGSNDGLELWLGRFECDKWNVYPYTFKILWLFLRSLLFANDSLGLFVFPVSSLTPTLHLITLGESASELGQYAVKKSWHGKMW